MTDTKYTYWLDDTASEVGRMIYIRRSPTGTDILRDGAWVPIDPARYDGAIDPWAGKIGKGDVSQVRLEDVPVREG
jgi:hypothetical protein